jgi:hypothetical protein
MQNDPKYIHDDDYYIKLELINNKNFQSNLKKFRKEFVYPYCRKKYGKPIKKFSVDDYYDWFSKVPVGFGKELDNMVMKYKEYKINREWLRLFIFFDIKQDKSILSLDLRNNNTELWVRIYGWTRKKFLFNNWPKIQYYQKQLPDYKPATKKWKTYDRDKWIYELRKSGKSYKEIKKDLEKKLDDIIEITTIKSAINKYSNHLKKVSNQGNHQKGRSI